MGGSAFALQPQEIGRLEFSEVALGLTLGHLPREPFDVFCEADHLPCAQ